MKILGISELDNDAGACAFGDGRVLAAANEERFSRIKQHAGFPFRAVEWICESTGLQPKDFDGIAIAKPRAEDEIRLVHSALSDYDWASENHSSRTEKFLTRAAFRFHRLPKHRRSVIRLNRELETWLQENGLDEQCLYRVDHHRAHALSAFASSGIDPALVVTCDGQGGGVTGTVWVGRGRELARMDTVSLPHSMGNFYAAATKALGFRPNRHEGKVTGLAAYAQAEEDVLEEVRRLCWYEDGSYKAPCIYGAYPRICRLLKRIGKESFASAFQKVLEEVVTKWVGHHLGNTGFKKVALAGGVFANVKLNQRIAEIDGVEEIFVFPGMADGGLGHGAALGWDMDCGQGEWIPGLNHVFWGSEPNENECRKLLEEARWNFDKPEDLASQVAERLAEGKTVAVCRGPMEFGPRALGHRSILYQATDPSVNDWLNKRLMRTEFMPFAPITRKQDIPSCYPNLSSPAAARFMTVTVDCSKQVTESCPAVVHVDGTARPQVVDQVSEPFLHEVLSHYAGLTGLPCLINTSFNLHEEPIVCTPGDALRAASVAHLDYLVLGPFLASVPTPGKHSP